MAETFGPFDGVPWLQAQWYRGAPGMLPSGVYGAPVAVGSGDLGLTFNGLNITVNLGRALIRGATYELTSTAWTGSIAANTNGTLARRDRLVLRRDLAAKTVTIVRLQGTPAASPVSPALQRVEDGQWDLPLFSFLVPANSGTVITDVVDERAFLGAGGSSVPSYRNARARDLAIPAAQLFDDATVWLVDERRAEYYDAPAAVWRYAYGVAPAPTVLPMRTGAGWYAWATQNSAPEELPQVQLASGRAHASGMIGANVSFSGASTAVDVGGIPTLLRPPRRVLRMARVGTTGLCEVEVSPAGAISITPAGTLSANTPIYLDVSWAVANAQ